MVRFTVRVELHGAKAGDYEKLHEKMTEEGFNRVITSDDGITYELPTAEYDIGGNLTRSQVRDKANAASGQVSMAHGILVTESAGRSWMGLTKIE